MVGAYGIKKLRMGKVFLLVNSARNGPIYLIIELQRYVLIVLLVIVIIILVQWISLILTIALQL